MTERANGVFKIIQTVFLVLLLIAFVIDRMILPQVYVGKAAETTSQAASRLSEAIANEKRISTLEEGQKYIKETLDRIEKKIDDHMAKGK